MKQLFKKSLSKLGFLKRNTLEIDPDKIKLSDTFIVSYPKSGNTWIRFIIANMIAKDTIVTMKNINNFVPGIYDFKDKINSIAEPRFIKTHHTNFDFYPKSIYIYRDYRDVLISYYHFQKDQNLFKGTISEFIQSKQLNTFGSWESHISKALQFQAKYPNRILLLSYESLLENTVEGIEKIRKFSNILPSKTDNQINELCSFGSLQNIEEKHGKVFDIPNLTFFRSGKSGQWKTELSKSDLEWIKKHNGHLLTQLGYLL